MDKETAHKARNTLQTIQSAAELLKDSLDEEGKERIECIKKDVRIIADGLKK